MKGTIYLTTDQQLKIVYDPYRMRIIETYFKTQEPQTATQIADIIGEPPGKVHYHVNKLHEIDVLQIEKTKSINGIQAKYYGLKYEHILVDPELRKGQYFREIRGMSRATNFRIHVEHFSEDIVKAHEFTFSGSEYHPGYVYSNHTKLYMTKEQQRDFMKEMNQLIQQYTTPDDSVGVYTTLFGLARVE
ncbi:ArsR/SmtB family transcription factor [Candidatus Xianfuyuplasma coldseepsis]|uniref:Helix-turn-helix domain-containing protein n=1 Tax=Candidatus Xianfuyuplasma coldseepsis TaxID=2782163 RepID=A0A7L7KRC3_9MOLU|nr:helix-turn-helix domain-containing protein [Xianfuyuplasma coldseepsis]QMS85283.1 helix-turn-helix domain-containing protein [Xianfuyuplasma coldseepsis]